MITVKELYDATLRGEGAIAKHAKLNPDMPVFLLIAQDKHAPDLVEKWAIWSSGDDVTVQSGKVNEAREICDQMRRWPIHKTPD